MLLKILSFLCLLPGFALAQTMDDSDLSGPPAKDLRILREARVIDGIKVFSLRQLPPPFQPNEGTPQTAFGQLLLADPQGNFLPARKALVVLRQGRDVLAQTETTLAGRWNLKIPLGATGPVELRVRLENNYWSIQDPTNELPYEWRIASTKLPLSGSWDAGTYHFDPATANGKLGFIHSQFLEALDLFQRENVSLAWWNRTLGVQYPGSEDYFSPSDFTLNLTRPETWDVNLHELGHAVMDLGTRSYGGGGYHKIDECYNPGLAWSEGWATFFAGAVHLNSDDPDAKFEYLVPRRAPIRIENVPEDVCRGTQSEWRVAAGLWDIYDLHVDGADSITLAFNRLWRSIENQSMGSFEDAWKFIASSLNPEETLKARSALRQNTLLPPSAPSVAWDKTPMNRDNFPTTAPAWDGPIKP